MGCRGGVLAVSCAVLVAAAWICATQARAQIAFSSNQEAGKNPVQSHIWYEPDAFNIWVMNDNGSDQVRLTSGYSSLGGACSGAWWPHISPNGTRIAYLAEICGEGEHEGSVYGSDSVRVMNDNGTGSTEIVANHGFMYSSLAWSPDGTMIAYLGLNENNGEADIDVASATGADPHVVVSNVPCSSITWAGDDASVYCSANAACAQCAPITTYLINLQTGTQTPVAMLDGTGNIFSYASVVDGYIFGLIDDNRTIIRSPVNSDGSLGTGGTFAPAGVGGIFSLAPVAANEVYVTGAHMAADSTTGYWWDWCGGFPLSFAMSECNVATDSGADIYSVDLTDGATTRLTTNGAPGGATETSVTNQEPDWVAGSPMPLARPKLAVAVKTLTDGGRLSKRDARTVTLQLPTSSCGAYGSNGALSYQVTNPTALVQVTVLRDGHTYRVLKYTHVAAGLNLVYMDNVLTRSSKPGEYELRVVASNGAGGLSSTQTARFAVQATYGDGCGD